MQTRDGFAQLPRILPNPRVFISGYVTREKIFSIAFIKKLSLEKEKNTLFRALIKTEILTSLDVLYTKLVRESDLVLQKRCFSKYGVFSLKMSA